MKFSEPPGRELRIKTAPDTTWLVYVCVPRLI
jgi:hypothetical protein